MCNNSANSIANSTSGDMQEMIIGLMFYVFYNYIVLAYYFQLHCLYWAKRLIFSLRYLCFCLVGCLFMKKFVVIKNASQYVLIILQIKLDRGCPLNGKLSIMHMSHLCGNDLFRPSQVGYYYNATHYSLLSSHFGILTEL